MEVNVDDPSKVIWNLIGMMSSVAMLQDKGYTGESDESVVNKWFNDVCRTVLLQEIEDPRLWIRVQDDVILVNDNDEE